MSQIQVELPHHLCTLARTTNPLVLTLQRPPTITAVLDELEHQYPMLRGTIRDSNTHQRRPFLRFFAAQRDLSLQPPETPLPQSVSEGREPLIILGAIAGG
jgi:hypothetical protein